MQFEILNFRRKIWIFAHFSINFCGQNTWYLSFFDLILLKLHIRPSLNQFLVFVLQIYFQKNSCVLLF